MSIDTQTRGRKFADEIARERVALSKRRQQTASRADAWRLPDNPESSTVERAAKVATRIETHGTDRARKASADRIVSPFEHLFERSTITADEREAGERFERDLLRSGYVGGLVSSMYGGGGGASGTPVSQQMRDIDSHDPKLDPAEKRAFHATRYAAAQRHIGKTGSAVLNALVQSEMTLEDIGRTILDHNTPARARGGAVTAIKLTLERLIEHYGEGKRAKG